MLKRRKKSLFEFALMTVLAIYSVLFAVMLLWAVLTSFKTPTDFRNNLLGLPKSGWQWSNFTAVINNLFVSVVRNGDNLEIGFGAMFLNTMVYALGGSFVGTLVTMLVAYVTAKYSYRFSKFIYGFVLLTMTLPLVGTLASELKLTKSLGIYDSLWGNLIQQANFLGLYYLIFHAAFRMIPNDFSEAAEIDGASEFSKMLFIMIPLVRVTFFTIMLIKFIGLWNDYQTPLIFLPSRPTLANGVFHLNMHGSKGLTTPPFQMASCVLMFVPIIALFAVFRNKIIGNLSMGGIKE